MSVSEQKQVPVIIQYLELIVGVAIVVFIAHSWSIGAWFDMGLGVFIAAAFGWLVLYSAKKFVEKHHKKIAKGIKL